MEFIAREITTNNWITILIVICLALLASAKLLNPVKFSDFTLLFNTNKYIVLQQKPNKLSTPFNIILIAFQIISSSLFIYFCWKIFGLHNTSDETTLFFEITILYTVVIICKILIEKIVGTIFSIDTIIEDYLFYKVSYRNFLGLILLPINILFVYTAEPSQIVLIALLVILLILNLIVLFSVYKKNENIILNHLFYFILYLCALEMAPYYVLYKLIS
ncbi:DUF4271 domain-containing protein [Aquimarina sp. 2201CG5-10]|uniref:DUF4271 domain-containing protein n=1 Tax=Aquimarina callyspongiae TaxID=3098150 RepID=UPI002AB52966|nr:DUF4271 domain-containing protein [Aquimarina sp. 2201CG5-10]MDY8134987.1 DUF4271 domain-containing protein [Aquimarina sp. 2201CG5-10]